MTKLLTFIYALACSLAFGANDIVLTTLMPGAKNITWVSGGGNNLVAQFGAAKGTATGGIMTTNEVNGTNYIYHDFLYSFSASDFVVSGGSLSCTILIVGGGGPGDSYGGATPGSGGQVVVTNVTLSPGTNTVIISADADTGNNGESSYFGDIEATGGAYLGGDGSDGVECPEFAVIAGNPAGWFGGDGGLGGGGAAGKGSYGTGGTGSGKGANGGNEENGIGGGGGGDGPDHEAPLGGTGGQGRVIVMYPQ